MGMVSRGRRWGHGRRWGERVVPSTPVLSPPPWFLFLFLNISGDKAACDVTMAGPRCSGGTSGDSAASHLPLPQLSPKETGFTMATGDLLPDGAPNQLLPKGLCTVTSDCGLTGSPWQLLLPACSAFGGKWQVSLRALGWGGARGPCRCPCCCPCLSGLQSQRQSN